MSAPDNIRRLRKELRRLMAQQGQSQGRLEAIEYELAQLECEPGSAQPTGKSAGTEFSGPLPVVRKVLVDFLPRKRARVTIDDHKPFEIPELRAEVLVLLAEYSEREAPASSPDDELVEFKSFEDRLLPAVRSGARKCSEHALVERISRLRMSLLKAELDGRLIEEKDGCYRFRVRRPPPSLFSAYRSAVG